MADIDGTNARLAIEDGPPQALNDITHLRITAIVKSDGRVAYEAGKQESSGSSQTITRTVRDDSYRWVKRDASSVFATGETETVRNDACEGGPMAAEATTLRRESESLGSALLITVPWIGFGFHLGDRIPVISGRDINLSGVGGEEPVSAMVEFVTYDFSAQETVLQLRRGTPFA